MKQTTIYHGATLVHDGYDGATRTIHLVGLADGTVLAVSPAGYWTFAYDKAEAFDRIHYHGAKG